MQLNKIEPEHACDAGHVSRRTVHKTPHNNGLLRQAADDALGLCRTNIPRASATEVEAESIGAGVERQAGIGPIGDAADLDAKEFAHPAAFILFPRVCA